jgi:SAM-dependent methyltransferase
MEGLSGGSSVPWMDLNELQQNWDELGRVDPLWAILTSADRKGGKWDLEEFFQSGRDEIANTMRRAQTLGLPVRREAALDFGCGVGRLTQALCSWFEHCRGVDIAPSMIELARGYNTHGGACEYFLNAHNDLRIFPDDSFDFVYSNIVLQHMEPQYSTSYITEFVRVLRPGGLAVFQVPECSLAALKDARLSGGQGAQEPMPDSGFHAGFSGYPGSIRAAAGAKIAVPVTVRNLGQCGWPSVGDSKREYVVQLGNHWLTPESEALVWDDGREPLPFDVPPNAQVQMTVTVTAPASPGNYVLELDMVQEGVAWFKEKSSIPALVQADIEPAPAAPAEDAPPRMEMYGVEKDKVIELLKSRGARVLDIREDGFAGPEWISYQYFATRS